MKNRKREPEPAPSDSDSDEAEDTLTFDRKKDEYEEHEHERDPEEEESDKKSDADFEDVEANFDVTDPSEADFHGLRALMQASRVCQATGISVSSISDFICNQGNIGSVVKPQDDDDDADDDDDDDDAGKADKVDKGSGVQPSASSAAEGKSSGYTNLFGVISVVNLRQDKAFGVALGRLADLARKHVKEEEKKQLIMSLLTTVGDTTESEEGKKKGKKKKQQTSSPALGLLINERVPNLPPLLLPLMHESLVEDFAWSLSTPECPEEERQFYKLNHLVFVGTCHCDESGSLAETAPPKKKVKKAAGKAVTSAEGSYVYAQPELEIYANRAEVVFFYPTGSKGLYQTRDRQKTAMLPEYCMVAFLKFKSLEAIAKDLSKLFSAEADSKSKVESLV